MWEFLSYLMVFLNFVLMPCSSDAVIVTPASNAGTYGMESWPLVLTVAVK
jgi:hypothetical protein